MRYTKSGILIFSIGVAFTAYAPAQSKTSANLTAGKELYHQHCSTCHGNDGKGSGTMYDPDSD